MLNKLKTRIKNKKVIMGLVSGILLILVNLGVIDNAVVSQYESAIEILLGVLVGLGVLADPESHIKE